MGRSGVRDSVTMRATVACPSCHKPVHLPGLVTSAQCHACAAAVDVPEDAWLGWFDAETVAEVRGMGEGEGRQFTVHGRFEAKAAMVHLPARCDACKVPRDPVALAGDAEQGGYTCTCGEGVAVRPAPPLARLLVRGASYVVGEGALGEAGTEPEAAPEPILFSCLACSAALPVDGTRRDVRCPSCGSTSYLPDGLWLRLHPTPTVRWFAVTIGEATAEVPEALIRRLAGSSDWNARRRAAEDAGAPAEVLKGLASDSDSDVRQVVAGNPSASPALLAVLAADDDDDVREAVCAHPSTPLATLEALSRDSDWEVRRAAVRSPRLPASALAALARVESDSDVLEELARRSELGAAVLASLARSESYRARVMAAGHAATPHEALLELASGTDSDVIAALQGRDALPADVLAQMATSSSYRVRQAAAAHPSTPPATLIALADDRDSDVLKALVARVDLPEAAVLALAGSSRTTVADAATAHPVYGAARSRRLKRRLAAGAVAVVLLACAGGGAGGVALAAMVARRMMRAL